MTSLVNKSHCRVTLPLFAKHMNRIEASKPLISNNLDPINSPEYLFMQTNSRFALGAHLSQHN
jgi:hypothetical protein